MGRCVCFIYCSLNIELKTAEKIACFSIHGCFYQVVAVYGTLADLLSVASTKFGLKAANIYNGKGGLIDDIALIR